MNKKLSLISMMYSGWNIVENTGAAMGFGEDLSKNASFWLLASMPLACLLLLFVYTIRKSKR